MKHNLRNQILIPTLIIISLVMGLSTYLSFARSSNALQDSAISQAQAQVQATLNLMDLWLDSARTTVGLLATEKLVISATEDGFVGKNARSGCTEIFQKRLDSQDLFAAFSLVDLNGDIVAASEEQDVGINVSDREYFTQALAGISSISKVLIRKNSDEPVFLFVQPVVEGNEVVGVLAALVDLQQFANRFILPITLGNTGYASVIQADGTVIIHPDSSLILNQSIQDSPGGTDILEQGNGVLEQDRDGVEWLSVFGRQEQTGWIILITVRSDELFTVSKEIGFMNLGIGIAGIIILSLSINMLINRLALRPLKAITGIMGRVSHGDLRQHVRLDAQNEIGVLANAVNTQIDYQKSIIEVLARMAKGDLSMDIPPKDKDDQVAPVLSSTLDSLNELLRLAGDTAVQVSTGSGQVSSTSQSLSQGATAQASSVEEISASMQEIGSQVNTNAENCVQANRLASEAKDNAARGSEEMDRLVASMTEINRSSESISKIIKVIDEIAFQTNLLALNAAVEAARAGQHGKGFAVVAEEVRNLAGRSATAARETAELIEQSTANTAQGGAIAQETAASLSAIVDSVAKVADIVAEISSASQEQAISVKQVNEGLVQVDQITQQNTASAEQAAAASMELMNMAESLKQSLDRFQLKGMQTHTRPAPAAPAAPTVHREPLPVSRQSSDAPALAPKHFKGPEDIIKLDDDDFGKYEIALHNKETRHETTDTCSDTSVPVPGRFPGLCGSLRREADPVHRFLP